MTENTVENILVVIEAPGKVAQLREVFRELGYFVSFATTKGHLYAFPNDLGDLGIGPGAQEVKRDLRNVDGAQFIVNAAAKASDVLIATDADTEGDVIALDVANLIADVGPAPLRVKLRGIDVDSVTEALKEAKPLNPNDAIAGRTRALLDRLIGATFSKNGIGVGRVSTALLGICAHEEVPTRRLKLVAPAKGGGRPWTAETDVTAPLTKDVCERLVTLEFPPISFKAQAGSEAVLPGNTGDVMVRASEVFGAPVDRTAEVMQRLYESGRMSYCRANSRGLSPHTARKLAKIVANSRFDFDSDAVPVKKADDVHDAIYPIGDVPMKEKPAKLGLQEGLRTMVAQDLVKSGQRHTFEVANTAALFGFLRKYGFSEEVIKAVAELPWTRENGPSYPGKEKWPESSVTTIAPDAALLRVMMKKGLGKPSTWPAHIKTFLDRELVDENFKLTAKGREWLAASPAKLLDPKVAVTIEKICDTNPDELNFADGSPPWEQLAVSIVKALPKELAGPIVAAMEAYTAPALEQPEVVAAEQVASPARSGQREIPPGAMFD